jgi:hypothetical protein
LLLSSRIICRKSYGGAIAMTITMPDPDKTHHLAHTEIAINAPVEFIWRILIDFENYNEWNPFTYDMKLSRFEVGQQLNFSVRLSPRNQITVKERFAVIDPPYTVAWTYAQATRFLSATRYQVLTPADDDTTTYTTWEQFSGLLAPILSLTVLGRVQRGFETVSVALKQYAELQYGC